MRIPFLVIFCILAAFTYGSAQVVRKATDKPAESRSSKSTPRRERNRVRTPDTSKIPTVTESDRFMDLGESFRKEGKWNAAEAAYKEAINVWSGNAEALRDLGFLYIDRNRLPEAQAVYTKLRSVNSAVAAELLADIQRYKAASR